MPLYFKTFINSYLLRITSILLCFFIAALPLAVMGQPLQVAKKYHKDFHYDSALVHYDLALKVASLDTTRFSIHFEKGRIYYHQKDLTGLTKMIEKLSDKALYGLTGVDSLRAQLDYLIACSYVSVDPDKSAYYFRRSLAGFNTADPTYLELHLRYIDLLVEELRLKEAKTAFEEAFSLKIPHNYKQHPHYYRLRIEYSYYLGISGDLPKAMDLSQEIYQNFLEFSGPDSPDDWRKYVFAEACRILSVNYGGIGNFKRSIELNLQYVQLTANYHPDDFFRYSEVYMLVANLYEMLGYNDLSSFYNKKFFRIARKVNDNYDYLRFLMADASKLKDRGKYEEALQLYATALRVKSTNELSRRTFVWCTCGSVEILNKLNRNEAALDSAVVCLEKARKVYGDSFRKMIIFYSAYVAAANAARELTAEEKTRFAAYVDTITENHYYKRLWTHLFLAEVLKTDAVDKISAYKLLMGLYLHHVREGGYRNYLHKKTYRKPAFQLIKFSEHLLRLCQELEVDFEEIEDITYHTELLISDLLRSYRSLEDFADDSREISTFYNTALRVKYAYYQRGRCSPESLYNTLEKSKSRRLDKMMNRISLLQNKHYPDSVMREFNILRNQYLYFKNKLVSLQKDSTVSQSLIDQYEKELVQNKSQYYGLMDKLKLQDDTQLSQRSGIPIDSVRMLLSTRDALIEHFVTPDFLYTFTVTKDTVLLQRDPAVSAAEVYRLRNAITASGRLESNAADSLNLYAYRLYEKLMKEPLDILKSQEFVPEKLYIIPDKHLGFVPFETLLTAPASGFEGDFAKLPYLLKDYDISYGYSASILFRNKLLPGGNKGESPGKNREKTAGVLAFAPSFEKFFSDETEQEKLGQFRGRLSDLMYNKGEVSGISDIFPGKFLKDEAATEKAFRDNFSDYSILHFATHGLVDIANPEYSRLVFTMKQDSENDNYLHNFELHNMNLDADMVVLSACNTGYGKLEGGEGVISLGRAFTLAGARSVVMSYWPADDQATGEIMKSFYGYLAQGLEKDKALRKAKLEYLATASAVKQSPVFWNNFMLMGDTTPITSISVPGKSPALIILVTCFISLCLVFLIVNRRKIWS